MYTSTLVLAEGSSVFSYFSQSNLAGKIIVLALIGFSFLAWTIMIGKFLDLTRIRQLNMSLASVIQNASALKSFAGNKELLEQGAYGFLTYHALDAQMKSASHGVRSMDFVENSLQRSVARQTIAYESKMIFLASIVAGAPFLGLLGTVWGVMDAFGNIAVQSSATLQSLAPGVSGALLTTVAGLLVAIPSVFGYNYLLTQTKIMVTELENFASLFADRLERELAASLKEQ